MRETILIAHNLRSCYNIGSLLRTADGLGVSRVVLSGYTPYPAGPDDNRLPHLAQKTDNQIRKTALGAERTVRWEHAPDVLDSLAKLRAEDYRIYALEQTPGAQSLPDFKPPDRIALLVGREVEGVEPEVLAACDGMLEIPMLGAKESFNVAQAAAMALYHLTYSPPHKRV